MRRKKGLIFAIITLMAVGFAAVSTTLYINGTVGVGTNVDEYEVYYSNAKINGVEDKSVIIDDTNIEFTTEMKTIGDTYELEYFITNGSRNYDADVTMNCTAGNDYVTVTNNWVDHTVIDSTDTKSGKLTLEMIKGYVGDDDLELKTTCTITASAAERESLGTGTPAPKVEHNAKAWVAVTGDGTNVGDEIAVGDEHFYVISNDGTTLNALAKYNLNAGGEYNSSWTAYTTTTGIQDSTMIGWTSAGKPYKGTMKFSDSSSPTWNAGEDGIETKATGTLHNALEAYKSKLPEGTGVRLITKSELEGLGCSSSSCSCSGAPAWVYSTSYWSGSANADFASLVWFVGSNVSFNSNNFKFGSNYGVRPVISLES